MNETLPSVSTEDIEAAQQLAEEAQTPSDVATLREMLADQNQGSVVIKAEDGSELEVSSIGHEKMAELDRNNAKEVMANMAIHSDSWQTDKK